MKARNNKTGEIVTNFFMAKEFGTISYLDSSKTLRLAYASDGEWTILGDENDDFSNSFDWQSFRAEAAKNFVTALIPVIDYENTSDEKIARNAIKLSEELVKQLKKEK